MTQTDRVLAALHDAGPTGVTQVDFSLPHVVDGGAPITRLAARIKDLRDQGFRIHDAGTRHRCRVYVIEPIPASVGPGIGAPTPAEARADARPQGALF